MLRMRVYLTRLQLNSGVIRQHDVASRIHRMAKDQSQVPTASLVQCFLDDTRAGLSGWLDARHGRVICDLTHANRAGRLERTTPGQIDGFFSAVVDFETPRILGTLTFGDREYCVQAVATPNGRPERHALWEWADAADRPELVPRTTDFVLQLDRMALIVRGIVAAVRELEPVISEAPPRVLERMAVARLIRQATQESEWREAEHRGTVRIADEAFRQRDWHRVVSLLESIEDRLTVAEIAKLDYARRRL